MTRLTLHPERPTALRSEPAVPVESSDRGRTAESLRQLPAGGRRDVLVRVDEESKKDHVMLLSAGVAFFGLLALVPALVALLSMYELVAEVSAGGIHRRGRDRTARDRRRDLMTTNSVTSGRRETTGPFVAPERRLGLRPPAELDAERGGSTVVRGRAPTHGWGRP